MQSDKEESCTNFYHMLSITAKTAIACTMLSESVN